MSWISIAIASIAIFALVFYVGRTARRVWLGASWGLRQYRLMPIDDVSAYLQRLLEKGHDGGFVVIEDPATDRFVQLKLHVEEASQRRLSFDFPRAPWSERYYPELQSRLEHDRIEFVLQPTLSHPVTEFLQIDCERRVGFATKLVHLALLEIFRLPRDCRVRITLETRG